MTKPADLPLLIFDLDGTLIDSAADIHTALNKMLSKYQRPSVDLPTLTSHIGDGLTKLVHDFFPEHSLDSAENTARVDEFIELYQNEHLTEKTVLYPGVADFLHSYNGPIALVTNKNIQPTLKILRHFKMDSLPWVDVIGGDSLSERKPSALPLRHVMAKASRPPQNTWMIGDGRPDMKSALAAGCGKIAVHYGYSRADELAPFKPDRILNKFIDIKGFFG